MECFTVLVSIAAADSVWRMPSTVFGATARDFLLN